MKLCLKDLTGAATMLAAALGLSLIGPHRAYAAPGGISIPGESELDVKILSPDPRTPITGLKPVDISAFYQGAPGNQIVSVELYLDGKKAATRTLDVPETRGVVSFLVDASQLSPGAHRVVVRVTAADQEVKSARAAFQFGEPGAERLDGQALGGPAPSGLPGLSPAPTAPAIGGGLAPTLRLFDPSENGKVQGIVTIKVKATDPSGKSPYVSLSIDKTFKTLRNFAPYEFEWDTTAYPNGYHTLEVSGYNDSANVGHAPALRVYVNNPGGETSIRRDLLDGVKALGHRAPRKSASRKSVGRPLPLRRPDLLTADAPEVPPRMASVMPAHTQSTREIVRHLVGGASSLRFGPVEAANELSTPFVSEVPAAPVLAETAPRIAPPAHAENLPAGSFKPLPAAPDVDPNTVALADLTRSARRVSGKIARLQRMAGLRLPDSDLASPFSAAPRVTPLPAKTAVKTVVKVAGYRVQMQMTERMAHALIQPVMKVHPLRVHLPASLGSLLHSVGQTSVLFNHTTVRMDRPLAAQGSVLFGPLRQIFEQGGGTLTWESRTGTVRAKSATKDILLTIGRNQAVVNAKAVSLDGKPYLILGRTMVPLSFVTAAMDADVQYDAATGHLLITSRK